MKERFSRGFTLIEVMVVVAIVAIIATIAIPNYQDSVRKSKRSEAKEALLRLQMEQEKYRVSCPQYATALAAATACDPTDSGTYTLDQDLFTADNYTIAITSADATSFVATATAKTGTRQVNDKQGGVSCTPMTLTVAPNGDTRAPAECW